MSMDGLDLLGLLARGAASELTPHPAAHPASAVSMLQRTPASAAPARGGSIALQPLPAPSPASKAASTALTPPAPTQASSSASKAASIALTPPKPTAAQTAASQAAVAKLKAQASTATSKAQKVLQLAQGLKGGRFKTAVVHAANVHQNKAQNAAVQKARSAMGTLVLLGIDISNVYLDPDQMSASINAMIAQGTEDDALATMVSDYNDCATYVSQLQSLGQTDLVNSGNNLLTQMENLAAAYDAAGDSDPSLPSKVAAIDQAYNLWLTGPHMSAGPGSAAYALNQLYAQPGATTPGSTTPGSTTPGSTTPGSTTPAPGTSTSPQAPVIASITDTTTGMPFSGNPGDQVLINGNNFTGVTAVSFGGMPTSFQVMSPTQITAMVPMNAMTGTVTITNPYGTGSSPSPFTLSAAAGVPGGGYPGGGGGGGFDSGGGFDPGYDDGGGVMDDGLYADDEGDYADEGDGADTGDPFGNDGGMPDQEAMSNVMADPYAAYEGDDYGLDDGSEGDDSGEDDEEADLSDGLFPLGFPLLIGHGHGGGHHHHGGGRGAVGPYYGGPWLDDSFAPLVIVLDGDGDDIDGLDALGCDLVGEYDIQAAQRQMNTLKQVTVAIARALVKGGQQVASETIDTAEGGLFQKSLPGITSLKNTQGHLQWHADALAKLSDPTAIYASGDDLKKWAMQAFIDANSVEEGRARQEQIWQDMWTEIGTQLASLPKKIAQTIASLPGKAFEAVTGVPSWVFYAGSAVIVVLLGVGVWKLLKLATPAVAGVAARRYLP